MADTVQIRDPFYYTGPSFTVKIRAIFNDY